MPKDEAIAARHPYFYGMKVYQIRSFKRRATWDDSVENPPINIAIMPETNLLLYMQEHHPELLKPGVVFQIYEIGRAEPIWIGGGG